MNTNQKIIMGVVLVAGGITFAVLTVGTIWSYLGLLGTASGGALIGTSMKRRSN